MLRRDRHRRLLVSMGHFVVWMAVFAGLTCSWNEERIFLHAQTLRQQPLPFPQTVRIEVLSLFHPKELVLCPAAGSTLVVEVDGHTRAFAANTLSLMLRASGGQVELASDAVRMRGPSLRAHSDGSRFWLEVPGKLRRVYQGTLEIHARASVLEAVVAMPLETAVASIVAAESPPGAGIEALKAQAIASRSFLVARQSGHVGFDFCDTTHCQFLRSPPDEGSFAAKATRATQGLILTWHDDVAERDRTLAAMYARSCGGRTRTLREIGGVGDGYPYYSVHCTYCSHHPEVWLRESQSVAPGPRTEHERLAFNRIHGWGAIPSLPVAPMHPEAKSAGSTDNSLTGRGTGHGIGLCQLGAAAMARHGSGFADILAHYYPNTQIVPISMVSPSS